jgi:hypothetical protein
LQSSLQELTVAHEELRASRESLQAAAEGITAERDQLQANCHELSTQRDVMTAERDAAWAERDSLQNSLQELTIAHDQLRASRLSISVANQILELASPGAARQKICCRNCKSTRTLVLAGAGRVAPFFALRVLGVRALDDSSLCLDACLCLDCLFLTHLVELPEESLSRLYFDYRKPSYNDERIFLEPEYEEIAGQIGQGPEISSRLIGLDKYFQQLESLEYIPPGTGLHARALDWGGADGKYIPSYISNNIEQIDIYDISLDSQSCNPRMHSSSINKSGYSYIQFCHVLEHVQHPLEIVRDVAERYLTESGLLYIEVPIEEEMELLARQLLTNGNTGYWVHEHINKYCVRSLTRLVKATGHLDIIDIREDKADLGWIFADNRSAEFPIIRCLCVKTPA